jgi:hypothetical protein
MQRNSSEVLGKEAELQVRLPNGRIRCTACARLCEIPEGKSGLCDIRGVTNNTYNEPSIFIEFAKDCGIEAHKKGIFNIFVSNGFDTSDSVAMMSKFLDCITVDFKGSGKTYSSRSYSNCTLLLYLVIICIVHLEFFLRLENNPGIPGVDSAQSNSMDNLKLEQLGHLSILPLPYTSQFPDFPAFPS